MIDTGHCTQIARISESSVYRLTRHPCWCLQHLTLSSSSLSGIFHSRTKLHIIGYTSDIITCESQTLNEITTYHSCMFLHISSKFNIMCFCCIRKTPRCNCLKVRTTFPIVNITVRNSWLWNWHQQNPFSFTTNKLLHKFQQRSRSVLSPGVKFLHRSVTRILMVVPWLKIDDSMTWYFAFVPSSYWGGGGKLRFKCLTWHQ